ncbi:hypothetical protein [Streptomyces sp. NPDC007369]|uniref:hypothetical protein n=1 Tax=Streptomyces sp. NPDC007369 TaxID=3154589 RepID=UPI00340B98F1
MAPQTAAAVVADMAPQARAAARKYLDVHPSALTSGAPQAVASVQKIICRLIEAGYTDARRPACTQCGQLRFLLHPVPGGRICAGCGASARYRASIAVCRRCGKTRPCPARGVCQACYYEHEAPKKTCAKCSKRAYCQISARDGNRLLCDGCRTRTATTCAFCGRSAPATANWPRGPVCKQCYARHLDEPGPCHRCGKCRALIGGDGGHALCGTCSGHSTDYSCTRCHNPGGAHTRGTCYPCAIDDQLARTLALIPAGAADQLQQLRSTVADIDNGRSALQWLRQSNVRKLFIDLTATGRPISHDALDNAFLAGHHIATGHMRKILVAAGSLPPRDEHLAQIELRLGLVLAKYPQFGTALRTYVRWSVLPRLRRRARTRPPTEHITAWARARIHSAAHFLAWSEEQGQALDTVAQEHVDGWLASGKSTQYNVRDFLVWAARRGYARELLVPHRGKPDPAGLDEDVHWDVLQQCLHDDQLPLDVRVAGALVHLYAQPLSRIVALTSGDIRQHPEGNRLMLDRQPVPLPPPLDALIEQLATKHEEKIAAGPGPTWLFQGSYPRRPMPVSTIQRRLNVHGIKAKPSRVTACLNLAQDLPPAVLASITGMHVITAEQWHRRAAPDWTAYLAARRSSSRTT